MFAERPPSPIYSLFGAFTASGQLHGELCSDPLKLLPRGRFDGYTLLQASGLGHGLWLSREKDHIEALGRSALLDRRDQLGHVLVIIRLFPERGDMDGLDEEPSLGIRHFLCYLA